MQERSNPIARRRMSRSTVLWISSALVGLLCFGLAMALNQSMLRADFYALLALEGIGYDRGMSERANRAAARPGGSPVVVLEVAETTLGDPAFRESPESFIPGLKGPLRYRKHERAYHARVVDNLRKLGAAVVVFDMVFDEPDPEVDVHFARAIKAHGKVILAAANDAGTLKDGSAERTISVQPPTETLRVAAAGMGAVVVPLDVDRTLRRFMWWSVGIHPETLEDTEIPSLGVAGAALYGGAPPDTVIAQEVKPKGTFLGRPIVGMQDADFGSLGSYIRFNGPSGSPAGAGSVAAYEEVFHVGDPSEEDPGRDERLRQQLAGKIVVIGNSSAVAQDRHRVPVFSRSRELGTTQEMPGVEVQAHMLQTALTGQYPRLAGEHLQVLLLLGCCLLTALLGRVLSPGPLVVAGLLAAVGLWVGSIQLLSHQLVFLEPVTATVGLLLTMMAETAFMYFAERRDKNQVRRQLSRHVGAGVADKLADDEWPQMAGESVEITMLFSDLQGFTSLSETMNSQELCAVLNRYFGDVIFPIVDKHAGTTDKLMGDGMMAYFGWPARHRDHAARAIRCALEMQTALEEWKRLPENDALPPLRTRVGIHTGEATIGEIGSGTRAEFTVIGDVVNVAARLEGMNKEFGSTILISDATRAAAGEIVPMIPQGMATVRGRKEPMPVYSIDPDAALVVEATPELAGAAR